MNCEKFADMMFDYIENGENKELEAHLSACESCRRELEECKKMLASVRESAPTPPADMKKNVMLAVAADAKIRRRRRFIGSASAVAAVLVLCVGIGVAAMSSGVFESFDSAINAAGNAAAPEADGENGIFDKNNGNMFDQEMSVDSDESEDEAADGEWITKNESVTGGYVSGTDIRESEAADIAAALEKDHGYGSVIVFVLKGEEAKSALLTLCDDFGVKTLDDGICVFDAADAPLFASRIEELAGGMKVYFDAYADSDSPEIAAVCVGE